MLRVHLVQIALNLSDPGMEALLVADLYVRRFCRFTWPDRLAIIRVSSFLLPSTSAT